MAFFNKIFRKKAKAQVPPWETIVETMYDKNLDDFADEVVSVVYSRDRSRRYLLLHDEKGFFTYRQEIICPFDELSWSFRRKEKNALPAMWIPVGQDRSLFANEEDLRNQLRQEADYQEHYDSSCIEKIIKGTASDDLTKSF